ncbi:serine hydrolase domain-containing protein [Pedobacter frigidisoli]|uniref:serine hydrolase domain-containing protein n=1 Tax=Pedobacter frigidisoli TaxID=2530455 RepID=UPI00292CF5EF|nr:serine hydrolase domain-containing protein [Pedobacter frigidisoli]
MIKKLLTLPIVFAFVTTAFSQTFRVSQMDSLFRILDENQKFMGSVVLVQNGKVFYRNAIGFTDVETGRRSNTETLFRIGSVSKMFTAALVLKAVEEKRLSLQDKLDLYFPEIFNSKKIIIRDLLNHRSGIHNFTSEETYLKYYTFSKSQQEMLKVLSNLKSDFEPGLRPQYSNSNYVILSYILEKVYGKPYADILKNKVTRPLHLSSTRAGGKIALKNNEAYSFAFDNKWIKDQETDLSIPMGAGSVVSNPTDLAMFISDLFKARIISKKSLEEMKTMVNGFGMGMFESNFDGNTAYGHTGSIDKFQSTLWYFPKIDLSVAIISNGLRYQLENVFKAVISIYFQKPFKMPSFREVTVHADDLKPLTGTYSSKVMPLKIVVTQVDNQLFAQATGQSAIALKANGDDSFEFEEAGIILQFNRQNSGMILKQGGKEIPFSKD